MNKPLPHQLLWEAREFAKVHHMYIATVHDMVKGQLVAAYVVYREPSGGAPRQRLFKRRDPADLLHALKDAAGVAA